MALLSAIQHGVSWLAPKHQIPHYGMVLLRAECIQELWFRSVPAGEYTSGVKILLSTKKLQQFKETLEARILECELVLTNAEQETRANCARHADTADQAAAEYERQTLAHKADVARQTIRTLSDALKRISAGNYGECAQCGGDIELKRLEAVPWARYCLKCQEGREQRGR
jgi:DnaK suppressor protein